MGRNAELATGFHDRETYQADLEPVTAHVVAQYHNANQGSSFFVHGGDRASSGYAVGGLKGVSETTIHRDSIKPHEWQGHRDAVRRSVSDRNAVAGSWVEDGKSVMDATNVVEDRDEAKLLQRARGERAVYNLHDGKEENLS